MLLTVSIILGKLIMLQNTTLQTRNPKFNITLPQLLVTIAVTGILTFWTGEVVAASLVNASFETPTLGDGGTVALSPAEAPFNWYSYCDPSDGNRAAYITNPDSTMYAGTAGSGTARGANGINVLTLCTLSASAAKGKVSVYQDSSVRYEAGKTYTFTAAVGKRNTANYGAADAFGFSLRIASTSGSLSLYKASTSELTADAFVDRSVSYKVKATDTGVIGQKVRVMLHMYTENVTAYDQCLDFDNVRLTVTPEPATMVSLVSAMLGFAAYAWRKRKHGK
jgi:hypothetical protein